MKLIIYFSILFIFNLNLFSQNDSVSFIIPEYEISYKDTGKENSYSFRHEENKLVIFNNKLYADPSTYNFSSELGKLKKISVKDGNYLLRGAAIGFGIGFVLAAIPTWIDNNKNGHKSEGHPNFNIEISPVLAGFLLGIPGAIIGGLFGGFTPSYDELDLTKISNDNKKSRIINFLRKQNN